jgi:4-hydroxybenzoate polyprenyltransferase
MKLRSRLRLFYQFIRFPAFAFSAMLPLLGAATISPTLAGRQIIGLIGVAFAFHNFGYVLNDIRDLPIDRSQPSRTESPLVQGIIRPGQALFFVLLQLPLAFALTWWSGGGRLAYLCLGLGFVLSAFYDLWGKRLPFPPLADLLQGFGWAALLLVGSAVLTNQFTHLTIALAMFIVFYIVLINGVHGSVRDLANDMKFGLYTTAMLLGARPGDDAQLIIPKRLIIYAYTLQVLLLALLFLPLMRNDFGYELAAWNITLALLIIFSFQCWRWLGIILGAGKTHSEINRAVQFYLVFSVSTLVILFVFYLHPLFLSALLLVTLGPLLPTQWWSQRIGRLAAFFNGR